CSSGFQRQPTHVVIPLFFSSKRRHTKRYRDWSPDVCSSDLVPGVRVCAGTWTRVRTRVQVPAQTRTPVTLDPPLDTAPAELVFRSEARRVGKEDRLVLVMASGAERLRH